MNSNFKHFIFLKDSKGGDAEVSMVESQMPDMDKVLDEVSNYQNSVSQYCLFCHWAMNLTLHIININIAFWHAFCNFESSRRWACGGEFVHMQLKLLGFVL